MRAMQHGQTRRAASGLAILMILVLGAVMFGVVFYAGLKLGETKRSEQAEASSEAAVAKAAANVPSNVGNDDEKYDEDYNEAAEEAARRVQALQQGETAADPAEIPPISFEPPLLDFGMVQPGKLVKGTIQIRNNGDKPVFIESSKASCSCTAVDMSETWIQPGDSVAMEATFTKQALGEKQAAVRFKIQGYDEIVAVDLKALVALPVMAQPAYIYAEFDNQTHQTQVSSGQITIQSIDDMPFRILAIDGGEPNYIGFDPAVDAPRSSYEVAWDVSDVNDQTCRRADGSKLRRFWAVETDHPGCPVFDVQVRHQCTLPEKLGNRRWVVSPQRILLGELRPGESTEVDVLMKWLPNSQHNEEVYSVLAESPHLRVEVVSFDRARGKGTEDNVRLRVTASKDIPEGLIYENARVHSQLFNAPLILIGRTAR